MTGAKAKPYVCVLYACVCIQVRYVYILPIVGHYIYIQTRAGCMTCRDRRTLYYVLFITEATRSVVPSLRSRVQTNIGYQYKIHTILLLLFNVCCYCRCRCRDRS